MKTALLSILAGLSLYAAAGGCASGPDPVALCNQTCDKVAACSNGGTSADFCKMQSDCAHATNRGCKNSDAIATCLNMCNQGACDTLNMCRFACPICQAQ